MAGGMTLASLYLEVASVVECDAREIEVNAADPPPPLFKIRRQMQKIYGREAGREMYAHALADLRRDRGWAARHQEGEHLRLRALAVQLRQVARS